MTFNYIHRFLSLRIDSFFLVEIFTFIFYGLLIWLGSIILYYGLRGIIFFFDYYIALIASKRQKTQHLTISYLKRKVKLDVLEIIQQYQFEKLVRLDWNYLRMIFELVKYNHDLFQYFCPHGQSLIRNIFASNYAHLDMNKFIQFYQYPVHKLIDVYLNHQKMDEFLLERIIYEHTPEQRKYLEEHLPQNHEILHQIMESSKIQINSEFKILK